MRDAACLPYVTRKQLKNAKKRLYDWLRFRGKIFMQFLANHRAFVEAKWKSQGTMHLLYHTVPQPRILVVVT